MSKFIEFKGGLINTRYIIAVAQSNRTDIPSYGIALHLTNDIIRQWFETEEERDTILDQLSRELLND
jgi:hypothetical protein